MRPSLRYHGRVVEQARQPLTFQRRRHQQQLERLVAQHQTRVERERQRQVGIQAALVEFVEDHQTDAFQAWVVLQTTGENAFGDHLDAGPGADLAVEANAIAHRFPDLFPQLAGQPLGSRPRRQPPRFEHQDALPGQPAFIQQRQRHAGGLAGAGRCLQHGFVTLMQRLAKGRQRLFDGQGGHGYSAVEAAIIRVRDDKAAGRTGQHRTCLISAKYQRRACIVAPLSMEVPMRTRSRVIGGVLAVSLFTQLAACGTLFYPDRRGQIDGKIDPAIAALNAVGLLFYVIPGLIAFGIDFATGAIYFPDENYSVAPETLHEAIGADGQIDMLRLKAIIEDQTGRSLPLDDPRLIQHSGSVEQLAAFGLRPAA